MAAAHRIACVVGADSSTVQPLFAKLVADWRASGMKIVGLIGEPHRLPNRVCSAGVLRDIVTGKPYPIYLDVTPKNTSCHVDLAGVEKACAAIVDEVSSADLVVLSKFGKLETTRRGLAAAFDAALAADKPVLTSVSDKHRDAWQAFAPAAALLTADAAAIRAWSQRILSPRRPPQAVENRR